MILKKYVRDLTVRSVERLHERYVLIRLTEKEKLPPMLPGQFVEVRVDGESQTFLRRPISINFVDYQQNELWLLIACVGNGTRRLAQLHSGDVLNVVLPLGNGFSPLTIPEHNSPTDHLFHHSPLLVGGGVGVAPLLFLGAELKRNGVKPTFLLGARTATDLLMPDEFHRYGRVLMTTEDGSAGERGFVTDHSVLNQERFSMIQCCGPTPMMKAVARYARHTGIPCEVSLENLMACGLGACLCCVEKVKASPGSSNGGEREGISNVCVCKEGPVFNINRLLWQD